MAILGVFLFSCSPNKPTNTIILAENASPLSTLSIIAREKGFFKEEGLNIQVSRFTSGKLALDAVLGGGADIATVAETPLMFAALNRQDFSTIATIFLSGNACKVVARTDRGISKPADLKGKKVATFAGTNAEFFTKKFLDKQGISTSELTILNLTPTDMVIALSNGDIDAYFVWEPHIYNGRSSLGGNAIVFEEPGLYVTTFNIAAKPKFLEENSDAAVAFIRALKKASTFVKGNTEESIAIISTYTDIPKSTLKAIWKEYEFPVNLDEKLVGYLSEQAEWAIGTGRVKPPAPDFKTYLNSQFLKSALK